MIRLSAFMIMGFLTMTIAQLIEAIYLGVVGTAELAAIAFTFPLVMSLNAAVRGIGIGASSVIARVIGAGDREARRRAHDALPDSRRRIRRVVRRASACRARARSSSCWAHKAACSNSRTPTSRCGSSASSFFATSMVGTNLLRSAGNAAMPGIVMTVGSLLQVLIGPFLIFGWAGLPALGIEGAAWSFVIARLISFALCMYWIAVKERMLVARVQWLVRLGAADPARRPARHRVEPRRAAVDRHRDASAGGLRPRRGRRFRRRLADRSGHRDGRHRRVDVGRSVRRPELGRAAVRSRAHRAALCHGFCLGWGVASFLVMAVCARWLVGMINDEPEVVETATTYLLIIPISLGFMGVMGVASACFNALGKPTPPLVLSLLRLVVVLIPLALLGRCARRLCRRIRRNGNRQRHGRHTRARMEQPHRARRLRRNSQHGRRGGLSKDCR